jgi:hypothetical protein
MVNNSSFGAVFAKSMGVGDHQAGSYPGKVDFVSLVSRTLGNTDSADVLK